MNSTNVIQSFSTKYVYMFHVTRLIKALRLCIPSKSAIHTFYSLGARLPSSCAGLPKRTHNLMAHDPFNARGADMKSRKRKWGAKDLREVIKRVVAPNPNPGNKYTQRSRTNNLEIFRTILRLRKTSIAFAIAVNSILIEQSIRLNWLPVMNFFRTYNTYYKRMMTLFVPYFYII